MRPKDFKNTKLLKKLSIKKDRRQFLKILAGIPLVAAVSGFEDAHSDTMQYGKLVDSIRCIGCKRCMSACKRWNSLEIERADFISDRNTDLNANNWVVVNLRADRKNKTKQTYLHWACQHCIKPACAGVCPVKAITKLDNGPVVVNENKCIGCRYCYQACPYKVPRYDFHKRATRKCTLCFDRFPLSYKQPACVAACPVGALSFGYRQNIITEANKRFHNRKTPGYIMGLNEAGGTSVITILPAKPQDLGLVVAPLKVVNSNLDKLNITAAGFMGASGLAGLMYLFSILARDKDKKDHDESS
jgi:formate dehydrogenase iron-sulfur subunit